MNDRKDLTSGSVWKKLALFALPIVAMNLLQAIYSIVDMIIVGQFVGSVGMSAVSIGGQITTLVLVTCSGISNGCSVYIGNLSGLKRYREMKGYVGSMLSFLLILALFFTIAIIAFCTPLLKALNTPAESFDDTRIYLIISMLGTVFVYGYGLLSAALRGTGESVKPLVYVIITTVENIVLDLLFVAVFQMGAVGAALATVISQATSCALVAIYVARHTPLFDFKPSSFKIDKARLSAQLAVGMPQAVQYVCTNISFLFISSLVNSFGIAASAAAGAANKLSSFGTMPGIACMTAIVTMTAQNHPRKDFKRIIRGMVCGLVLSLSVSVIFVFLCQIAPETMYRLFTSDSSVLDVGISYLKYFSLCFIGETTMFCLFGVITGSGYTRATMFSGIFSSFAVRYLLSYLLCHYTSLGFDGIALGFVFSPFVGIAVSLFFFITGKWKKSRLYDDDPDYGI